MKNNDKLVQKEEFRWSFRKKGSQVFNICKHLLFLMGFATSFASTAAIANPTGGTVVSGAVTISNNGSTETINQTTQNAIINWNSFNIAKGETTQVNQLNAASTEIEQIFKSGQLTAINGSLLSNGRIIIINPNGVIIGKNGNINTAGFIASSAGLANSSVDPNATIGSLNFSKAGKANAKIVNKGTITVADTGLVALVAPTVRNDGLIKGNLSKIQLGAADTFGVDLYGDGLISLAVGPSTKSRKLKVENNGEIIANGGQVLMTAAAASKVVDSVINNKGVIEANTLQNVHGQIVLKAPGATTKVSGKLQAKGGTIETSGEVLSIAGNADIEASNWLLDPNAIEIKTGTGTASNGVVYQDTLEASSQAGTAVLLQTTGSGITLDNLTSTANGDIAGYLIGGSGNITLQAENNGSVVFKNTSNTIVSTTGNISILAGSGGIDAGNLYTTAGTISATATNGSVAVGTITGGSTVSLTSSGTGSATTLNGNITTNGGSVTLNNNVLLGASDTIATNGGTVTFDGTVDSASTGFWPFISNESNSLAVNAGSITVKGAIGGNATLSTLALTSTSGDINTGSVTLNGTTGGTTAFGVSSAGALTVTGNVSVTNSNDGSSANAQALVGLTAVKSVNVTGSTTLTATDNQQPNISATASLAVVSTTGDITLSNGVAVTSTQNETHTGGTNKTSTASVALSAASGKVTVNKNGISVSATAKNSTTDKTGSLASAGLSIAASGAISLNGPVTATSYVNAPDALVANGSVAGVNIQSTGDELYFSQAPVALASDSQNTAGAQVSDAYNGLNDTSVLAANSSNIATTNVYVPSFAWYNPTTGAYIYAPSASGQYTKNSGLLGATVTLSNTTAVAGADAAGLVLSGEHTIAVTDNATKQYAQDDSTATFGTATEKFNYIDPLNSGFDNTADASSYISSLGKLTVDRTVSSSDDEQVASYNITLNGLPTTLVSGIGTGAGNLFDVVDASKVNGASGKPAGQSTLTITAAPLGLVAANIDKTYGDTVTFNGTTYSVTANGSTTAYKSGTDYGVNLGQLNHYADGQTWTDTISSLNVSSTGAAATANVASPYAITVSGATGTGLSNYDITYGTPGTPGVLTIDKRVLTVDSIADGSSTYGDALIAGAASLDNVVNGDAVSGTVAVNTTGLTSTSGNLIAGTHTGIESVSGLTGAAAGNYSLAAGGATGNYDVAQRTITASIAAASSTYGDGITTGAVTLNNTIAGDSVSSGNSVINNASGHFSSSNNLDAGTYNEAVGSTLNGSDAGNYSFAGATGGVYTVNTRTLTVASIAAGSSTYGQTLAPGSAALSNVINGDAVSGTVAVNTTGNTSAGGFLNAGNYTGIESVNGLAGNDAANYTVAAGGATGNYKVNQAILNLAANQVYNATTTIAASSFETSGTIAGVNGETLTLNGSAKSNSANVGTYSTTNGNNTKTNGLTTTGLSLGSGGTGSVSNYTLVGGTETATINPAVINLSGSETYNGTTTVAASDFTTLGLGYVTGVNGQILTLSGNATSGSANVGTYSTANSGSTGLTASGLKLGSFTGSASNYTLVGGKDTATITPASLVIYASADAADLFGTNNKVYDSTTNSTVAAGEIGLVKADAGKLTIGADQYSSANAGLGTLSVSGYNLTDAANYNVTLVSAVSLITPKALTASISDQTKVYDGTTSAALTSDDYTLGGFIGSQGATVSQTAGAYNSANVVGATSVTASLTGDIVANKGTLLSNYTLPTTASGNGSITPATLTASISDQTKVYDGTTTATLTSGDYTLGGFIGKQGATVTQTAGAYDSANVVGATTVTANLTGDISANTGTVLSNYTLPTTASGNGSITPATLTVSISDQTKVYDGTTTATLNSGDYTLGGFIGKQGATVTQTVGAYDSANVVGATTVTANLTGDISANTGTVLSNYMLPTTASGNGSISPATLTITADPQTKVYGTTDPTLAHAYTEIGLVSGDTISGKLARSSYGTLAGEQVGSYNITKGTVAVDDPSNYNVTFDNGTLKITPAALTITATTDQTKTYGTNDNLTYTPTGLVDATVDGVKLDDKITGALSRDGNTAPGVGTLAGEQVGSYAINLGSIGTSYTQSSGKHGKHHSHGKSVDDSGDYTIALAANDAALTITPAALTIAAVADTKTYDGTTGSSAAPAATGLVDAVVDGVQLDDTVTATQSFASANVLGNGNSSLSVTSYTVNDGNSGKDYATPTLTSTSGTINPEDITITTGDVTKIYDGNTNVEEVPSLIVTQGTLYKNQSNGNAQDTLANGTYAYTDANAGTGDKTVVASGVAAVDGNSGANYTIHYANNTTSTISQADLTVTADNFFKVFGFPLTFKGTEFTTSGTLYGQDAITGVTLTSAGSPALAKIGTYAVNANNATGTGVSNYDITYIAGSLGVVSPANLGTAFVLGAANRPIVSVAGTVIDNFVSFAPQSTGTSFNISLRAGQTASANGLSNIEPAAGGDDTADNSPSGLANIEPAAGGNGGGTPGNKGDFACANAFLDGTACTAE